MAWVTTNPPIAPDRAMTSCLYLREAPATPRRRRTTSGRRPRSCT